MSDKLTMLELVKAVKNTLPDDFDGKETFFRELNAIEQEASAGDENYDALFIRLNAAIDELVGETPTFSWERDLWNVVGKKEVKEKKVSKTSKPSKAKKQAKK